MNQCRDEDPTPPRGTVNPLQVAVEAMRREQEESGVDANCRCPGNYDALPCDDCLTAMLRAALPHLLRAVTEALESVAPEAPGEVEIAGRFIPRVALLSALTNAAERVAK